MLTEAMSLKLGQMSCPQCNLRMAFDKKAFGRNLHCGRCGAKLRVSAFYSRVLMAVSMLVAFGLLWLVHPPTRFLVVAFGQFGAFVALLAIGWFLTLVVMILMMGIAPRLISPPLLPSHEPFTLLNLRDDNRKPDPDEDRPA